MARTARGLIPPIDLSRESYTPLFRQIEKGLREAILDGRLPVGCRLPSTRSLAVSLEVSRTTIVLAFDYLRGQGYLETRPGGGTFVAEKPEHISAASDPEPRPVSPRSFSARGMAVLGRPGMRRGDGASATPFALQLSQASDFPFHRWATCQTQARRMACRTTGAADPKGRPELRTAAAAFLHVARGLPVDPEQVVIVGSVQEALLLIGTLLLDPGDPFWFVEPGHPGHRVVLESIGGVGLPIGYDASGVDAAAMRELPPEVRLGSFSPGGELPLGIVATASRRAEVLAWAAARDGFVVENEWDPGAYLVGRPSPTLAGQDRDGRVIYMAGLGRVLVPAVRIGFLVLPPDLVDPILTVRSRAQFDGLLPWPPPPLDQLAVAAFLSDGHLERMMRRLGPTYQARNQGLAGLLEAAVPEEWTVDPGDGMTYTTLWAPDGTDDVAITQELAKRRLDVAPVSLFYSRGEARPGLILGSAVFEGEEVEDAVERLAEGLAAG